ncbi:MAG: hypothetical protein R6X02_06745 [Enhygromyxa sp.]
MPGSLHQRILALVCASPEVALILWSIVEPEAVKLHGQKWIARSQDNNLRVRNLSEKDSHRLGDCVITLHPADDPDGRPKIVLVVECQLKPDERKIYSWAEYLAAARRLHRAIGRIVVMSPVDNVIVWAHGVFEDEPKQRPELVGREQVPRIDDLDRALRHPELAVLSAVFHGPHEDGAKIAVTAAQALRTLPEHVREEYFMLLEDALPEEMMPEIRKVTFEEAQASADEWMRGRGPYKIGHREGLAEGLAEGRTEGRTEGREQGRTEGLLRGRRDALALALEIRGLVPSAAEQARIDDCKDIELIERWCERAKTAAAVADLFDGDA